MDFTTWRSRLFLLCKTDKGVIYSCFAGGANNLPDDVCESRQKRRESDVWQRRFYEHTIRDEVDLRKHLDYLHFNPVKHGLVKCVHDWEYSSFHRGVRRGEYDIKWAVPS
jgi:putative transposase